MSNTIGWMKVALAPFGRVGRGKDYPASSHISLPGSLFVEHHLIAKSADEHNVAWRK
jgi:hypothetical protein